jgi:hypothetical protein
MYGLTAVLVIGLLTAVFGFAMQAVIPARRRRRPGSLGEKAQGIVRKGRGPVVGALILTTLATAGVVVSSHLVESSPVGGNGSGRRVEGGHTAQDRPGIPAPSCITECYSPTIRLDFEAVEELVRQLAWGPAR